MYCRQLAASHKQTAAISHRTVELDIFIYLLQNILWHIEVNFIIIPQTQEENQCDPYSGKNYQDRQTNLSDK